MNKRTHIELEYFTYYCVYKHLPRITELADAKCLIGIKDYMRQKEYFIREDNNGNVYFERLEPGTRKVVTLETL